MTIPDAHRRARWLRIAQALALAGEIAAALTVDPYLESRPGGLLSLPPRTNLVVLAVLLGACVLTQLALAARRAGWSRGLAWPAAGLGLLLLFESAPFTSARAHALVVALLLAALVLGLVVEQGLGAEQVGARVSRAPTWRVGAALFVLVCLLFEGAFSFVARSHAVGYTLAARLWFGRCWGTRANSLGYRDHEHVDDGRPNLFVLGDSFVAGVGICDPDERFTDRLQLLLGDDYQVHNLGWNGSDTRNEYERLLEYPFTPRVLVLAYYINDITGAAGELGHSVPPFTPYLDLPGPLRHLVMRSYVLDFAYWLVPHDDLAWQAKFNARCYSWPDVVARHQEELQRIVDWAREHQCPLIALLFPSLTQVETSGPWLAPALELFAKDEVPVVDVRTLVKGHATAELVANANDAHPSAWLHARVAEALAAKLVELGLAEATSR